MTTEVRRASATQALARQLAHQRQSPRIVKLELILTEGCNLGCSYCFELVKAKGRAMPPETARAAIDFLVDDASRGSDWVGISFMGGEPMAEFELLREAADYARERAAAAGKAIAFDMTTNGTLIEESHLRWFREVDLRFCLSLDGLEADHDRQRPTLGGKGSFRTVADKLRLFKRYQHWQGTRMTVTPETAARVDENVRGLHELGINQFTIGFATHVTWTHEAIRSLSEALMRAFEWYLAQRVGGRSKRLRLAIFEKGEITKVLEPLASGGDAFGCGAGSGRLAVTPSGVYHGCSKLAWGTGGTETAPLPMGDVASGLSSTVNRDRLLDHSVAARPKCEGCELRGRCNGGCYAANHAATGDAYLPPEDFCELTFALAEVGAYARRRMEALGLDSLAWGTSLPDLEAHPPAGVAR